jgi:peptide/nickel transport system ATP-binding protein
VNVLECNDLVVRYGSGRNAMTAVDSVSLVVPEGQVLGIVGESGSGKSTIARAVMGLVPIAGGSISVNGKTVSGQGRRARQERARNVQLIFQDPYSSLDPRMTVKQIIGEALHLRGRMSASDVREEVARLLEFVNLEPSYVTRFTRELSGGQRQRVAIARALAVKPRLIIADEITSALDVSVQAHILNLMREIQRKEGLSMLFISHNLATVRYLSDQIGVMYLGKLVETGPAEQVVDHPQDEYTRNLLEAVPVLRIPGISA